MKNILAGTALALAAFAATPAAAQAVYGPRVEIHGGADILRVKIPGFNSPTVKLDDTGINYGLGVGYDFPLSDAFSLGIEGDIDRSTARLHKTFLTGVGTNQEATYRLKPRLDGFVGARASYAVSDTSNFYLKGGYARASFRETARVLNATTGAVITSLSNSDHVGGWRVGGGAQVSFANNLYFGGEVQYTDYKGSLSRVGALLALGVRFGARPVVEVAAPVVAPAPEPAPAPATQTCADGSVILATDACPVIAPPPAPTPERG